MKRVFLVGYMGAGKTSLGKIVAKKCNLEFIDLDHYIENRFHQTISEIFAQKGESGFREIEKNMLHEVAMFEDVIIATGGGTPCFFDNAEFMNASGECVYLKTSVETLFQRLRIAKDKRPILKDKTDEQLRDFIASALAGREANYLKSEYIFDANDMDTRDQIYNAADNLIELVGIEAV